MKRFFTFLCALTVLFSANALPVKKAFVSKAGSPVMMQKLTKAKKMDTFSSIKASSPIRKAAKAVKAPKAESDYVVITTQPLGQLKSYKRSGGSYVVQNQQLYTSTQSGEIEVVFGIESNEVYFKDIVSGLPYGTWVKGTFNDTKDTVHVALGQNLRYVSQYDACVAIQLLNYSGGFAVDSEAKEVLFLYDSENDIFSLYGTGVASVSLAGVWTDDGTIQNYGDYGSVYTPFVPNTDLVELPDGLEPKEMPLSGSFFASADDYPSNAEELHSTVKVAQDGDTLYIQGLLPQTKPEAWVKGTLSDGTFEFPVTYIGTAESGDNLYAQGYSSNGVVGFSFTPIETTGGFELVGYVMVSTSEMENTMDAIYESLLIGERPELVEVPEDAVVEEMPISGLDADDAAFRGTVKVARKDADIYIQGLSRAVPSGWIKGTFNEEDNIATFPTGQYVGVSADYNCSVYLLGADEEENIVDITFAYDPEKNVYRAQTLIFDNANKTSDFYYIDYYQDVVIGDPFDAQWIAGERGFESNQQLTSDELDGITFTFTNAGTNPPAYLASDATARLYAADELTIAAPEYMAKIVIEFKGTTKQKQLEANVGEYSLAGNTGTWNGVSKEVVFTVPNVSGNQARILSITIYYADYSSTIVTPPATLETSTYIFKGTDYNGDPVTWMTEVGFEGKNVYIQGLSSADILPEAWVLGEIAEDGTVTIPEWSLGTWSFWGYSFDLYFSSYGDITYDAEADQFAFELYAINIAGDEDYMESFSNVTLTKYVETAATPADPTPLKLVLNATYPYFSYDIPTVDVDGNDLNTNLLSYIVFFKKDGVESELELTTDLYSELSANMTEIPYSFSDNFDVYNDRLYLNQDAAELASWTNIGIQTIYRGLGEENRSNLVWLFDDVAPVINTCVANYVGSNSVVLEIDATDNVTASEDLLFRVLNDQEVLAENVKLENGKLTIDGLSSNTEYTLTVIAIDEAGNESNPATVIFTTSDVVDEDAPVLVNATLEEVSKRWATISVVATDNETPAENIIYVVTIGEEAPIELTAVNGVITLEGLTPETEYSVQIQAKDIAGNLSDPLNEPITFTTEALTVIEMDIDWVQAKYYPNSSTPGAQNWAFGFWEGEDNYVWLDSYDSREEANAISGTYSSEDGSVDLQYSEMEYNGDAPGIISASCTFEFVSYDEEYYGQATYNASFRVEADDDNVYVGSVQIQVLTFDSNNTYVDMIGEVGGGEGIEDIVAEGQAVKVIRNNQVLILKGDKVYNVFGTVVK